MAAAKSKRRKRGGKPTTRHGGAQQHLFRRGGKRRGPGRKSRKARPGRRHERRAEFPARNPLHVVLRVDEEVRTLRRRAMYKAIRTATLTAAQRQRIRIVHISLQRTHLHLIVEAAGREALARGMQGFQISCARHINRAVGIERGAGPRRGRVFADRYYVEIIATPTQALRALTYVLCNWRHHGEDRVAADIKGRGGLLDPFSSGEQFLHWVERERGQMLDTPPKIDEPLVVCAPTTWLLTDGWRRVGSISAWAVPGTKARGSSNKRVIRGH